MMSDTDSQDPDVIESASGSWLAGSSTTYTPAVSRELASPVLIGRRTELQVLNSLLDQVIGGSPAVALIAGEAGVGKSRFVAETTRLATERGVSVYQGGCLELGGEGVPLAPLVDVLRTVLRTCTAEEIDALLGPARAEFARLLPELDPTVRSGGVQEGAPTQLFEHVLGLITRLAARHPLLLIVEDLHWADRSTRDLLVFLVQTVRELGVLLLITYRSDELHRRHPLRPLVTEWERLRVVERMDLGRFSRAEVVEQLEAIRGDAPTTQFTDIVFERSQGNAFLVEEILASVEAGADAQELPPSLRDVLLARTERVSDAAQRVLRTAAAAGSRVDDRLLQAVTGLPDTQWYAALREAVEHHLLVVDASGRGYTFRHELTRDALYDDMLPGERVRLHMAYGEAIASDPTLLGDDAGVAATLAYHWYAALDLPRALEASVEAGRQAAARYAAAEALRHFERALQIWPRVHDAAERSGTDWADLSLAAAEAAWAAGEPSRGLSILDQVLSDPAWSSDPLRRAHLIERRAFMLRALGGDAEAVRQLTEALEVLPAEPVTRIHAAVLASLGNSLLRSGEEVRGQEFAARAVEAAAATGAAAEQADALISVGSVQAYRGDADGGLAAIREGLDIAERNELHSVALRAYVNLSDAFEMIGKHGESADAAGAGIALAERVGRARSYGAMLVGNRAEALMHIGRWRESLDLITEALADDPPGTFASTLLLARAELHLWQGEIDAASADVRESRRYLGSTDEVQFNAPMTHIEAAVAYQGGDLAMARRLIEELTAEPPSPFGIRYLWPLIWFGLRIEADAETGSPVGGTGAGIGGGRPPGADRARVAALTALATTMPATTPPARVYRLLAAAEAARLRRDDDVNAWQDAIAASRNAQEAFLECYALFRLAETHCNAPQPERSLATLAARDCLRLADDLAASTANDVRALARRARLRIEEAEPTPSGAQPAASVRFRLTDRELEVLGLVAAGRSNGQIATALFISPKTASVHVSNILAKLGASSRTEAATSAQRLGLLEM